MGGTIEQVDWRIAPRNVLRRQKLEKILDGYGLESRSYAFMIDDIIRMIEDENTPAQGGEIHG